jgi:hypothetical protein
LEQSEPGAVKKVTAQHDVEGVMRPSFMTFLLVACLLCTVDVSVIAHERHPAQTGDEKPGPEECQVDAEGRVGSSKAKNQLKAMRGFSKGARAC